MTKYVNMDLSLAGSITVHDYGQRGEVIKYKYLVKLSLYEYLYFYLSERVLMPSRTADNSVTVTAITSKD